MQTQTCSSLANVKRFIGSHSPTAPTAIVCVCAAAAEAIPVAEATAGVPVFVELDVVEVRKGEIVIVGSTCAFTRPATAATPSVKGRILSGSCIVQSQD